VEDLGISNLSSNNSLSINIVAIIKNKDQVTIHKANQNFRQSSQIMRERSTNQNLLFSLLSLTRIKNL